MRGNFFTFPQINCKYAVNNNLQPQFLFYNQKIKIYLFKIFLLIMVPKSFSENQISSG